MCAPPPHTHPYTPPCVCVTWKSDCPLANYISVLQQWLIHDLWRGGCLLVHEGYFLCFDVPGLHTLTCAHTHHHVVCVTWKSDYLLANYIIKPTGQSQYFSDVSYQHFHFDWWRHLYWNKEAIHLGGHNHHNPSHLVAHSDLTDITCTMVDELWLVLMYQFFLLFQ